MKKYLIPAMLVILVVFSAVSCKKRAQVKGVELNVVFSEKNLTDNLYTDVRYIWKTGPDFQKMDQDYNVFVHFWHNTNMLIQDDYVPDPPVSAWESNKEYETVRRVYIPSFIDEFDPQFKGEETLKLSIGLYSPFDRSGSSKLEIFEKKLKVVPPPPDTPEVVYEEGWYDQENDSNSYLKQWRWTAKEAKCLIDNPQRDALLVIRGGVNLDAAKDQKVIFKINDTVLDEFVPAESNFEKSYSLKKEQLGDKNEFYLVIATDKTFIPAQIIPNAADQRELGLQIAMIYFR